MDKLIAVLLGVAAAVAAIVAYLGGSVWVLINVMPAVFFFTAGVGAVLGLGVSGWSVAPGFGTKAPVVGAGQYRGERLSRLRLDPGEFQPDSATPAYLARQLRADLTVVARRLAELAKTIWHWSGWATIGLRGTDNVGIWFVWPIPLTAVVLLLAACAGAALGYLVLVLTSGAFTLVVGAIQAGVAVLLRSVEAAVRKVFRAQASCPHCYQVRPRPAYRCPGCGELHRDVRPGRLGLLYRRCACGHLLPTMVLRASRSLEAVCQVCEKPLRKGAATMRDVRIPIFGDTSAGKTRFLYAALDQTMERFAQAGSPVTFVDDESRRHAELAVNVLRSGQDTTKTSPGMLPQALSFAIGSGIKGALVHLFDVAGEHFRGSQMHDALAFLHSANGLVYVLDPFSIPQVQDQLTGKSGVALSLAHPALGDPESAYGEVVNRIRDSGVSEKSQRLAIVLSKCDLLPAGGLKVPKGSVEARTFLVEHGLHNIVSAASREFAEVRYFTVGSVAFQENADLDAAAPLTWLLSVLGVRLPDPSSPSDVSETVP